jgi:CRP-like cAMP-binding protein
MLENTFQQIPIFADLTPHQLRVLDGIFELDICSEGEIIFEQGGSANYLYIVVEGEVVIHFKPDDGELIDVATIKNGGVFGWSAAFGTETYTSGATCSAQTRLLKVRGDDLKKLRIKQPETGILILERLAAVVAERMENSSAQDQVVALLEHALTNGVKPIGG